MDLQLELITIELRQTRNMTDNGKVCYWGSVLVNESGNEDTSCLNYLLPSSFSKKLRKIKLYS